VKLYRASLKANVSDIIGAQGNYVRIISSTVEEVAMSLHMKSGKVINTPLLQGLGVELPEEFVKIELKTDAASTVRIMYGRGKVDDSRISGAIKVEPSSSFNGLSPISFTVAGQNKTIAANVNRDVLDLFADPANTGVIYVGSVDGNTGIPIVAGQSYPDIKATGAIQLWGTVSGDKLHIVETA